MSFAFGLAAAVLGLALIYASSAIAALRATNEELQDSVENLMDENWALKEELADVLRELEEGTEIELDISLEEDE